MRKNGNTWKGLFKSLLIISLFIIIAVFGSQLRNWFNDLKNSFYSQEVSEDLKISFIDVGQADCILIQNNGKNMLIDAGNNKDGKKLVKYIQQQGIKKFDIIVGTHPHEDHIGGLDNIIDKFEIEKIYMPDVSTDFQSYVDVTDAIKRKGLKVTTPEIGDTFEMGECKFRVVSTGTDKEDINSTSIVLKMTFGNKSFLFTADATIENEQNMLDKDISADVLKVGHHGSTLSTSKNFLNKVNPQYAIIMCGKDNDYGHPHKETLKKFSDKNIKVYRTDELGTIVIKCDGKNIDISNYKTDTNKE